MTMDLPPPGFRGLDPDLPVVVYRRHLPHWRQQGATYFVTFRLADSLPQQRLMELKEERDTYEKRFPHAAREAWMELTRAQIMRIDQWLDQGHGSCLLDHAEAAAVIEHALHHFDGERYALFAQIVMPNHAHVVLRPEADHPLERIIESWKKYTSRRIHTLLGGSGNLWQEEYYDHIVRDTDELRRVIRYLEKNADHTSGRRQAWITPAWMPCERGPNVGRLSRAVLGSQRGRRLWRVVLRGRPVELTVETTLESRPTGAGRRANAEAERRTALQSRHGESMGETTLESRPTG